MEGEIQSFNNEQFGTIRIAVKGDKVWFCLSDVCKSLGIGNPSELKKRLQEGGIISTDTPITNQFGVTYNQKMIFINEPNLYRCIFQSRKAEAVLYQNWVFDEVLPSIRKHGAYMTPQTLMEMMQKPESVMALLTQLQTEQTKRLEAEKIIEEQKDKVEFADAVIASKGCIFIAQLANLLYQNGFETGQKRLFQKLRDLGFLYKVGRENRPKQQYVQKGYFKVQVEVYTDPWGDDHERLVTMVTPLGQKYFIELFCGPPTPALSACDAFTKRSD